jgi:2-polyprenyl-3-methyl-5-hydroxy-6-metoxy-1,4-benzoquinol methylase
MPSRDYHESVWGDVPEGLQPADAGLRERFVLQCLAEVGAGLDRAPRVLDIGCGEGHFAAALARAGAVVVAVDVAAEPVRRALERHPHLDVRLAEPEAELALQDASFDMVWAGETIEHVGDTSRWLSELRRVLRSGGVLAISTPDHGPLLRLWLALSAGAFQARFDPRGDHLRFYTRGALAGLLGDFGFEDVVVRGAGGPPGARRVLLASARRRRF